MIDAYATAGMSFKEQMQMGPDDKAYKRLLSQEAVVVKGCYDNAECVLQALGVSYQPVNPDDLVELDLSVTTPLFINCPGELSKEGVLWLKDWVEKKGGCVVSTDWALTNCIEKAFPGFVEHNGRATSDDVVSVKVAPGGSKMLGDLVDGDDDPRWWLERASYPIRVLNPKDVEVLIDSEEMKGKYGDGAIAVRFHPGKGTVYHMVSHAFLQRTKANASIQEASGGEFLAKKGITGDAVATLKGGQTVGEIEAAYLSIGFVGRILSGHTQDEGRQICRK